MIYLTMLVDVFLERDLRNQAYRSYFAFRGER